MTLLSLIKNAATALCGLAAPQPQSPRDHEIPVGTGADNEYQILISGVPHLFLDEGDHVVHFVAVFERQMQHTSFGCKLLPEVVPRWSKVGTHRGSGVTPQSVAEVVIGKLKADPGSKSIGKPTGSPHGEPEVSSSIEAPTRQAMQKNAQPNPGRASNSTYTVGTLIEWGEMEFPNRKPGRKKTYTSFAVKLNTAEGEKTLPGEGLKDALANAGCKIGDRVAIKQVGTEKVPAFDQRTRRPILDDETGEQKLWDRKVWQVNHIH
ncbi:hypothetical protein RN01_25060 [Cupriavidus sp. SHE]|uniref:hypothetical protein n=1 Tax=Cupriavidus TaxID=106589 RepID=UPI000569F588|nr:MULTISPECIES: hypothetical protein [Cupriavidus]KWR78050.1 hypothetical protein RN01_25060 [Cupriavidus sp. SHE]